MNKRRVIPTAFFLLFGIMTSRFSYAQKLTVAFTGFGKVEGPNVYHNGKIIGKIVDVKPNKLLDTFFVTIQINRGTKIPMGSKFFVQEKMLTGNKLEVEFSNSKTYYSSNNNIIGEYRPFNTKKKKKN